jgi:hypothetical protein
MRTPNRITVAVAGCSAVALALVGCGTLHAGQGGHAGQKGQAASTRSAATARTANSTPSPAQRAAADADSLLAAFPPPPGAVKTGPLAVSWLAKPPETTASPDLATRTSWWRAPGQPDAVLSWIRAHVPSGFTFSGPGYLTREPHPPFVPPAVKPWKPLPPNSKSILMRWDQYSKPPVPGVLSERWLLVSAAAYGTNQVAIRVDSEVTWLPAKPAGERVPGSAKVVTITPLTFGPPAADDHPVTITDPAKVAEIAAVVDGLPVFPPGVMSCPVDFGGGVRLTFRATLAGPTLAVVTSGTSGCGAVQVTVSGKRMLTLSQGGELVARIRSITGLSLPEVPSAPHSQASPVSLPGGTTSGALPR